MVPKRRGPWSLIGSRDDKGDSDPTALAKKLLHASHSQLSLLNFPPILALDVRRTFQQRIQGPLFREDSSNGNRWVVDSILTIAITSELFYRISDQAALRQTKVGSVHQRLSIDCVQIRINRRLQNSTLPFLPLG